MDELPAGTVTFLFTDIEGSTRLLDRLGGTAYAELLADHARVLRQACRDAGGHEVDTQGDAFFVAFEQAEAALAAAAAAQRALAAHPWPQGVDVRVRMGVLTGEAVLAGRQYVGMDVHSAARIAAAAHGGQVLVADSTRAAAEQSLRPGLAFRALGEHLLKDIPRSARLHQLVIDGLEADFPPPRSLDAFMDNLPSVSASFVGRTQELAQLVQLLSHERLITLTGPGGTGKTRLAIHFAAQATDEFQNGVCFVPLAALEAPNLVGSALTRALSLHEADGRPPRERLFDYLADKHLLLLMDNFEHVAGAAPLVSELLAAAPKLKVVATSRAPLHVYGEREFPVEPLGTPGAGEVGVDALAESEAVALFVDRATAVAPSFRLASENAAAVGEIVRRLDGLPLAVELAAARVKLLPPDALLHRLANRLDLAEGGARDLPSRHRTLRGALAWSHDLLDDGAQGVFARLGVFAGGAGLDEAELVCAATGRDVLLELGALVDQSLLKQTQASGAPRFLMLPTIRQFALERLADRGEAREAALRHAHAFATLAERVEPHLTGADARAWLDRLGVEHDNVRAALRFCFEAGDAQTALRLAAALWRFWQMRGYLDEGREYAQAALGMSGAERDAEVYASALEAAAGMAYWQSDFPAARAAYERALAVRRECGHGPSIANALYNLAMTYSVTHEDIASAQSCAAESLELFRAADDRAGTAKALWALGNVGYFSGDFVAARTAYAESVAIGRALDDPFAFAWALYMLALAEEALGDAAAKGRYYEACELFSEIGDVSGSLMCLNALADVAAAAGDTGRAARLAAAAAAAEARSGVRLASFAVKQERRGSLVRLLELEPEEWARGKELELWDAVAFALGRAPAVN